MKREGGNGTEAGDLLRRAWWLVRLSGEDEEDESESDSERKSSCFTIGRWGGGMLE